MSLEGRTVNRRVTLTPEQRDAVYTAGNVRVRAGAGSGKTEILAQKFVAYLAGDIPGREPLAPERIAAITFTEKATADMRRRIAEVLEDRITREEEPGRRAGLVRARRTLGLARISTIHAFCARFLRENPIEAGVDPAFEVLDEYQGMTFLERQCRNSVADGVRRGDPGAKRLAAMRTLGGYAHRAGAIDLLENLVGTAARLGNSPAWIREKADETASELRKYGAEIPRLCTRTVELVGKLLAFPNISGTAGEALEKLRARWPQLKEAIPNFNVDSRTSEREVFADLRELLPKKQNTTIKPTLEEIDGIIDSLENAFGACRAVQPTLEIAAFIADAARELEQRKREERAVTFDDLLILTKRLLESFPEVASRYRRELGALLVDEYQDTDPVQDAVVRLLTQHDDAAPELFMVGDEKQSIYRFRGADVSVFNQTREPLAIVDRPLRENRRSLPAILEFVNVVSSKAMAPDGEGTAKPYKIIWGEEHQLKAVRDHQDGPAVELITAPNRKDSAGSKQATRALRRIEADAIAQRAAQLVTNGELVFGLETPQAAKYGDIVLLLRAFTDVAIYESAFERAGVPYYTVKGRGFYGCKEVQDIAALLAAIGDSDDSLKLAVALRSPFFGLSDQCLLECAMHLHEKRAADRRPYRLANLFNDEHEDFSFACGERVRLRQARDILRKLRSMRERAPLAAILERALELTQFEAVMLGLDRGVQRVANIRKLLEIARDFETHRFFGLGDFVHHLRRLIEDDQPLEPQAQIAGEGDNVVRLMTIHQAKGLEFPIVILGDVGRQPHNDSEDILMTRDRGLLVCDRVGAGSEPLPNPLLPEYRDRVKDEEKAEAARLLYVAMTRARDRLILSEGAGRQKQDWIEWVRSAITSGGGSISDHVADTGTLVNAGGVEIMLWSADVLAVQQQHTAPPAPACAAVDGMHLAATAHSRIGFHAPAAPELITNPNAMADFERCPRQYYFRHEIGLPETRNAAFAMPGTSGADAAAMGIVAHAVLEQIGPAKGSGPPQTAGLESEIARLVEIHGAGFGLGPADQRALVRDLAQYLNNGEHRPASANGTVVWREMPFFMSLADGDLTVFVRGRIDLLVDDGVRLRLIDYKYARPGGADYRVQMECYALAAADAFPGRTVVAEIVYLRGGAERRPLELPNRDAIRQHLRKLGGEMAEARARRSPAAYPKRPADASACHALGCGHVGRCWRA
jgi:ATP-dependent helicase/nuclease subunit A